MKKLLSKLCALVVAITMVLGVGMTAFAAETPAATPGKEVAGGTITISGLDNSTAQTVKAYPIYYVDPTSTTGYTVAYDAFKTVTNNWTTEIPTDELPSADVTELAKAAGSLASVADQTAANGTTSVTFSDLKAGAYLFIITEATEAGKNTKFVYTPLVQANYKIGDDGKLATDNASVNAKKTENKFTKEKVVANGNTDADLVTQNGDILTYKITATIPFDKSEFKITDTIKGAAYYFTGKGAKFEVKDTNETADAVTIEVPTPTDTTDGDGQTFTVDLSSLLDKNARAGHIIAITYTAKVTDATNINNVATSTNSDDKPSVDVYTGIVKITKTDEAANANKLAGAKFALSKTDDNKKKTYAKLKKAANGDVYVTGEWSETAPTKESADQNGTDPEFYLVVTGDDGTATIKGLDTGTYTFEEIVAPDGYARNENGAEVTVTEDKAKAQTANEATMIDTKLNTLPSTGGIGTYIFTIVGVAVMVVAAAFFIYNGKAHK